MIFSSDELIDTYSQGNVTFHLKWGWTRLEGESYHADPLSALWLAEDFDRYYEFPLECDRFMHPLAMQAMWLSFADSRDTSQDYLMGITFGMGKSHPEYSVTGSMHRYLGPNADFNAGFKEGWEHRVALIAEGIAYSSNSGNKQYWGVNYEFLFNR